MLDKKQICVIIPIYKDVLNDYEIISVKQCLAVLHDYSLIFVSPKELNLEFYKSTFPVITDYVFFDEFYFKGVEGYNKLMLSVSFYKAFKKYEYMLVYQTDCYVFRDELLVWAQKGYDYIGGIWFENFNGNPNLGAKLWCAGNGGLSLRNIKSMNQLLTSRQPLKNWSIFISENRNYFRGNIIKQFKLLLTLFFNSLGYKNNSSYTAKHWEWNEDFYFVEFHLKYNLIKIPDINDALFFSWDRHPKYLLDKIKKLPFGCHAWYRNDSLYEENKDFWLNYIKINS